MNNNLLRNIEFIEKGSAKYLISSIKIDVVAILSKLGTYRNFALLVMRAGIGCMMVLHGYPKIVGGPEKWAKIGYAMSLTGIDVYPTFWGFMAAFAESIGGVLLMLGLLFRPAALLLLITMIVAGMKHISGGDGIMSASHAIELAIVFLGMFILGPGKYSVDKS